MTLRFPAIAIVLAFLAPAAFAAGDIDSSGWTSRRSSESAAYRQAKALVEAENYQQAVTALERVVKSEPRNADAFNYLGYSYRKLGDTDAALKYYNAALAIDPDHLGAHEYLGELYLEMDDLASAKKHLARLDEICRWGCEEHSELEEAIGAYEGRK